MGCKCGRKRRQIKLSRVETDGKPSQSFPPDIKATPLSVAAVAAASSRRLEANHRLNHLQIERTQVQPAAHGGKPIPSEQAEFIIDIQSEGDALVVDVCGLILISGEQVGCWTVDDAEIMLLLCFVCIFRKKGFHNSKK